MALPLLALYEKLNALPNKRNGFDESIKNYIVTHLMVFPQDEKDDSVEALDSQLAILHEEDALRQHIDEIIIGINLARESWQAKHDTPSSSELQNPSEKRPSNVLESGFEYTLEKMKTELQTESSPVFAEEGKKLHDALSDIKNEFIQTGDSNKFIHDVKEKVKQSEPTLKNSPVWKQFLLDILNAAILICTLGISYMATGRVRLFTSQPQESEIDEAKTMRQGLQ